MKEDENPGCEVVISGPPEFVVGSRRAVESLALAVDELKLLDHGSLRMLKPVSYAFPRKDVRCVEIESRLAA